MLGTVINSRDIKANEIKPLSSVSSHLMHSTTNVIGKGTNSTAGVRCSVDTLQRRRYLKSIIETDSGRKGKRWIFNAGIKPVKFRF